MSAEKQTQEAIKRCQQLSSSECQAEALFISELLGSSNTSNEKEYTQVQPEDVGALTSAPLISDGVNVYGFMDYCLVNPLDELAAGKKIVWQKG